MGSHHTRRGQRALAIDPRIDRLGYAWFTGRHLMDWDVTPARLGRPTSRVKVSLVPFAIWLLDQIKPTVVIVPKAGEGGTRRGQKVVEVIRAVVLEARRRDMAVVAVTNQDIKVAFRNGRPAKNKAVINRLIVARYPELTTSMPKARRPYDPERYFTPLFNAVALFWTWQDQIDRSSTA